MGRTILLVLLTAAPAFAYAQAVTTGTITGATKDQSGAAIPGVTLTLTNKATGSEYTVVSDDTGSYRFVSVAATSGYELKAELPSFRTVAVSDITVRPGGSQRIDLTLEVGELAEELTVIAEAPLINAESSQVSEGLGENLTRNLPLAKREFAEIAVLFQGIQQNPSDNSGTFTQYHARGMPTASNAYRVDGANVVWTPGGRIGLRMTATAIEQYEFIAGGFSAEYGEQAGSVVNLTTKSGTNQTAWNYTFLYKPKALTSNIESGLANQVYKKGLSEAHFQEFSIGGPILRDRVFYHNSFQWEDEKLGNLVTPKRGQKYFTSDRLKVTYDRGGDRWDVTFDINPSMQHFNGYRSSETSLESDSQQRVGLWFASIKNTRTFHTYWVTETLASLHSVINWSPAEARSPWSPRGMYRGPLRTQDFVNVFTPSGRYTTGPKSNWGVSAWKRFRVSEKLVRHTGRHNLRFGGEYGFNFGDYSDQTYFVRNFTDQRLIGRSLNRNDGISQRVDQNAHELILYVQDGWKITPNVLLEAGVRMDGQQRGKSGVNDLSNVVPRLGLTIDPTGTGRNRIFANWGLYHEFLSGGNYTFGENTL
ncbi:MAG: TonB-dependent receptor, partial [Acidobacteria bacterium]|nr:TonB-dependent receptor [Acidobacteriota bacterium]